MHTLTAFVEADAAYSRRHEQRLTRRAAPIREGRLDVADRAEAEAALLELLLRLLPLLLLQRDPAAALRLAQSRLLPQLLLEFGDFEFAGADPRAQRMRC